MKSKSRRLLLITEDFPSGLNGTSVKTRNTLNYLLDNDFVVDVCCFHFEDFKVHDLNHKNLRIHTVHTKRNDKRSFNYFVRIFLIIFSVAPITIKRLFSFELQEIMLKLTQENSFNFIIYDGYSTLQYVQEKISAEQIYIDDEDFTDLFKQRFINETSFVKKIFFFSEYLKSLVFERLRMSKVSQVWAISPRTKVRLEKVSSTKTVLMPTYIPLEESVYGGARNQLVFTGTLNWRENVEGLKWFIKNHWNNILKQIPEATLVVIGQGATTEFINFLDSYENINYKGYVKSLVSEYRRSAISIAPVRINAGIKVKILTYMSYALPVVSTDIASWGLISTDGIQVSSDEQFSQEVVRLLRDKKLRMKLSKKAHKNIKDHYSMNILHKFFLENLSL